MSKGARKSRNESGTKMHNFTQPHPVFKSAHCVTLAKLCNRTSAVGAQMQQKLSRQQFSAFLAQLQANRKCLIVGFRHGNLMESSNHQLLRLVRQFKRSRGSSYSHGCMIKRSHHGLVCISTLECCHIVQSRTQHRLICNWKGKC